mgnify:CR=1 FL=1
MKAFHKQFEVFLQENDSRYTAQKKEIVKEILKLNYHFEVDEFVTKMREKKKNFARATVYRTIKQLFDAGMIQKITTKEGKVYYEATSDEQHDHFICNQCGKIIEVTSPGINELIEKECEDRQFIPVYRSLHVYVNCSNEHCSKKLR